MGAHTFGKNHVATSLFRYTWTSRGNTFFNNDYYKMITDDTRWYFNDDACTKVGDAYGNRPARRWLANYRWTYSISNSTSILWISATMAFCLSTIDNDYTTTTGWTRRMAAPCSGCQRTTCVPTA